MAERISVPNSNEDFDRLFSVSGKSTKTVIIRDHYYRNIDDTIYRRVTSSMLLLDISKPYAPFMDKSRESLTLASELNDNDCLVFGLGANSIKGTKSSAIEAFF